MPSRWTPPPRTPPAVGAQADGEAGEAGEGEAGEGGAKPPPKKKKKKKPKPGAANKPKPGDHEEDIAAEVEASCVIKATPVPVVFNGLAATFAAGCVSGEEEFAIRLPDPPPEPEPVPAPEPQQPGDADGPTQTPQSGGTPPTTTTDDDEGGRQTQAARAAVRVPHARGVFRSRGCVGRRRVRRQLAGDDSLRRRRRSG